MLPERTTFISVVMPAYNEGENILANLLETVETFEYLQYPFEIILVDDGSPDETYLRAIGLLKSHRDRVRIVHYAENQGKGNALMCGTWYTRGDLILFLDADMDLHPSQLPVFLEAMERQKADVVIGSKRHRASTVNYPFVRRVYSFVYYTLIRLMFGLPVKDTQTGFKLFKREVLERVLPRVLVKRFAFDIEVLANAHRLGYKVIDAPVTLHFQRPLGRIRNADIRNIVIDTLAIFYRMHILHYYDRAGRGTFTEMNLADVSREVEA